MFLFIIAKVASTKAVLAKKQPSTSRIKLQVLQSNRRSYPAILPVPTLPARDIDNAEKKKLQTQNFYHQITIGTSL
jgi:hypothetical protein